MPDDVSLPGPSGDCFTGCERPNDPRQVRRWQVWRTALMTAQDAHEKRHGSRAAPAASPARGCWAALALVMNEILFSEIGFTQLKI